MLIGVLWSTYLITIHILLTEGLPKYRKQNHTYSPRVKPLRTDANYDFQNDYFEDFYEEKLPSSSSVALRRPWKRSHYIKDHLRPLLKDLLREKHLDIVRVHPTTGLSSLLSFSPMSINNKALKHRIPSLVMKNSDPYMLSTACLRNCNSERGLDEFNFGSSYRLVRRKYQNDIESQKRKSKLNNKKEGKRVVMLNPCPENSELWNFETNVNVMSTSRRPIENSFLDLLENGLCYKTTTAYSRLPFCRKICVDPPSSTTMATTRELYCEEISSAVPSQPQTKTLLNATVLKLLTPPLTQSTTPLVETTPEIAISVPTTSPTTISTPTDAISTSDFTTETIVTTKIKESTPEATSAVSIAFGLLTEPTTSTSETNIPSEITEKYTEPSSTKATSMETSTLKSYQTTTTGAATTDAATTSLPISALTSQRNLNTVLPTQPILEAKSTLKDIRDYIGDLSINPTKRFRSSYIKPYFFVTIGYPEINDQRQRESKENPEGGKQETFTTVENKYDSKKPTNTSNGVKSKDTPFQSLNESSETLIPSGGSTTFRSRTLQTKATLRDDRLTSSNNKESTSSEASPATVSGETKEMLLTKPALVSSTKFPVSESSNSKKSVTQNFMNKTELQSTKHSFVPSGSSKIQTQNGSPSVMPNMATLIIPTESLSPRTLKSYAATESSSITYSHAIVKEEANTKKRRKNKKPSNSAQKTLGNMITSSTQVLQSLTTNTSTPPAITYSQYSLTSVPFSTMQMRVTPRVTPTKSTIPKKEVSSAYLRSTARQSGVTRNSRRKCSKTYESSKNKRIVESSTKVRLKTASGQSASRSKAASSANSAATHSASSETPTNPKSNTSSTTLAFYNSSSKTDASVTYSNKDKSFRPNDSKHKKHRCKSATENMSRRSSKTKPPIFDNKESFSAPGKVTHPLVSQTKFETTVLDFLDTGSTTSINPSSTSDSALKITKNDALEHSTDKVSFRDASTKTEIDSLSKSSKQYLVESGDKSSRTTLSLATPYKMSLPTLKSYTSTIKSKRKYSPSNSTIVSTIKFEDVFLDVSLDNALNGISTETPSWEESQDPKIATKSFKIKSSTSQSTIPSKTPSSYTNRNFIIEAICREPQKVLCQVSRPPSIRSPVTSNPDRILLRLYLKTKNNSMLIAPRFHSPTKHGQSGEINKLSCVNLIASKTSRSKSKAIPFFRLSHVTSTPKQEKLKSSLVQPSTFDFSEITKNLPHAKDNNSTQTNIVLINNALFLSIPKPSELAPSDPVPSNKDSNQSQDKTSLNQRFQTIILNALSRAYKEEKTTNWLNLIKTTFKDHSLFSKEDKRTTNTIIVS